MKRFVVVNLEYYHEEWEPELRLLYFELCRLAEYRDVEVDGVELTKGQLLTSQDSLSSLVGRDRSFIRTALKRLAAIGAIQVGRTARTTRRKGAPFATVITVNYPKSSLQQDNDGLLKVLNRNQPEIKPKISGSNMLINNNLTTNDSCFKPEIQPEISICDELISNNLAANNGSCFKPEIQPKIKPEIQPKISDSNVLINNDLTTDSSCLKNRNQPEIKPEIQPKISTQRPNFQQFTPPIINNNIIIDDVVNAREAKKNAEEEENAENGMCVANRPKNELKAGKTDEFCYDPIITHSEYEKLLKGALSENPRYGLLVYKTGVKVSQATDYIDEFVALCEVKEDVHRGKASVLMHFVNFLRKKGEALRREERQAKLDKFKITNHGNYKQQEEERFERTQRELIGDMLGTDGQHPGATYRQSKSVPEDDSDVLGLPPI